MTRTALVLAMVSALFLGGSVGFMSGVVFSRHHLMHASAADWRGPGGPRRGPGRHPGLRELLPHLQERLGLAPDQVDAIRGEIEHSRADFDQVRDSLHARIERHLTPEQRGRWLELVRERHEGEPRGSDPDPTRPSPGKDKLKSEGETPR